MLKWLRYGSVLPLALVGLGGCEAEPACGDGMVGADEVCDDGNRASGDGCSASCELDDDVRTPGDDRSDYFWCAPDPLSPGVMCPVGTLCCLTEPSCATREQGCQDPLNVATCDGPEDCGAGEHCQRFTHDRICRNDGILTFCHTDRDCQNAPEGLPGGTCTASGVCDFSSGPELP